MDGLARSTQAGLTGQFFTVKFMDTVRHIPVDDILYFETGGKSHRIILHGKKGNMDFTGNIRDLQKSLGGQFLRVHRAYLANVRHIRELDVEQNIIFPVLLDYQKPDRKYLEELLSVLGLKERRNHLPSQLSGGQQQRVAIGRALITRPSLILADEPTGNLDTQNTSEVIALLKEASKKYEQTILMITHSRGIAQTADRILEVSDGVLRDFGSTPDLRDMSTLRREEGRGECR